MMVTNKIKKISICVLAIVVFLVFVSLCFFVWYHTNICRSKSYGIPELIYYSVQVVGVLMTTAAVVVALFGKEIRSFFFIEHCKVFLTNGDISENLGETKNSINPQAQSYDCFVSITNDGNRDIADCQVFLKEVWYRNNTDSKFKRINSYENNALYWRTPDTRFIDLHIEETRRIPLFKVYPQDSCQTPDQSIFSFLRMRIIGCNLMEKYSKQGTWKTTYVVRSKEKILSQFELTFQWSGKWYNRLTCYR